MAYFLFSFRFPVSYCRVFQKAIKIFKSVIDPKLGLLGAVTLGTTVFFINQKYGWYFGLSAALKQAVYTFFFGGFIIKLCETLAKRADKRFIGILLGTLIPTCLALTATFTVHSLKGTPEPYWSTLPTLLTAPPAFFVWSWRKSRRNSATITAN